MIEENLSSLQSQLTAAKSIIVLLPQSPNLDQIAAGLALYISLKKSGKQATCACSTQMRVEFSDLYGINQIQNSLTGRNLVVSFDYQQDSIDKVSYNIEGNKFNIVIQTNPGYPPLASDKVQYSYSGGEADLIFVVGARDWQELGTLAQDIINPEKQLVINLDNSLNNSQFGKINLVDTEVSCRSEMVAGLISRLNLGMDAEIASNLFMGLEKATQNFSSPKIGAGTFEAAAYCLRSGARRTDQPEIKVRRKKTAFEPLPTVTPAPKKPSADWFEPKIYKGNTHI